MEIEKQKLLINYLISSQELFTKVSPILRNEFFDPTLKKQLKFIRDYFEKYKAPPTPEQIKAETGAIVELKTGFTKQESTYAENELETFCRDRALEEAIYSAPPLIAEGNHEGLLKIIREAMTISLHRNIGLDYFQDPELRLLSLQSNHNLVPTLWHKLDEALGGGLNRKEMIIFAAPPGVGKSLTMGNLSRNLMKQGLNGVYFTLELSEEVVAKRFDSMFSGLSQVDLMKNITKASIEIKKQADGTGRLFIKRMPESSTNVNHLRAYLKEFEIVNGFVPDFIVVDYLDLMASAQSVSAENTFIRDKFISEELRALANEYNCIMITASQLGRGSLTLDNQDDVSQANIAGGISKINTTDNAVSIMQDAQQKARGEMKFKLLKTRSSNGVGNSFMLKFSSSNLLLENFEEPDSGSNTKTMANMVSRYVKNKPQNPPPETPPWESDGGQPVKPSGPKPSGLNPNNLPFQV